MDTRTQAHIRRKLASLKRRQAAVTREHAALKAACTHPNAVANPKSDTGNWCSSDDCYWNDCFCPDCGKHWTENQ